MSIIYFKASVRTEIINHYIKSGFHWKKPILGGISDRSIIRNYCSRRAHPCPERVWNSKAVNTTNLLKQLWSHSKPGEKMSLILKKDKITSWPCWFLLVPASQLHPSERGRPAISGAEPGPKVPSKASWLTVAHIGQRRPWRKALGTAKLKEEI